MRKNVTGRTVIIVATILICVFGIIGFPRSGSALLDNLQHNIRLGLDLKGGSHLVLLGPRAGRDQDRSRWRHRAHERRRLKKQVHRLCEHRPERSGDGGRCRQDRDRREGRAADQDLRLPQLDCRPFHPMDSDAAQFHRLPPEYAALRTGDDQTRHGGAVPADHQQPHQPARPDGTDGAAIRPGGYGLRNPGGASRRGRSGARERNHADHRAAGDRRCEGRSIPE